MAILYLGLSRVSGLSQSGECLNPQKEPDPFSRHSSTKHSQEYRLLRRLKSWFLKVVLDAPHETLIRWADTSIYKGMAMKKEKKGNVVAIVVALISFCGVVSAAIIGLASPFSEKLADLLGNNDSLSLSVHVADSNGQSISGAKVILFSSDGSLSQYTDSNGTSTFDLTSNDNLRLIIEATSYQIFEKQIQTGENTIDVRLSDQPSSSADFILRAVQEGNNIPVSGIEITIVVSNEIYRQTTDSDGFAKYTLPFLGENTLDAQISVNAKGFEIENQISTLSPGKLQYVLLMPNSLTVEIPDFPTSVPDTSQDTSTPSTESVLPDLNTIIGTGIDITQIPGNGLRVELLGPSGEPWENVYVRVYEQQDDASGNPSIGQEIGNGRINKQGQLDLELSDGVYVVCSSEMPGYGWTEKGCVYNVKVESGNLTVVRHQVGNLEVAISDANNEPWNNVYFEICTQKEDVNGYPVTNDCKGIRTDNTGVGNAWLTPGLYIIKLDLTGYNWGDLVSSKGDVDIYVQKGSTNRVSIQMGQLIIGLSKPDGGPDTNVYLEVFTQKTAVNGEPTTANRIWTGRTDNGGYAEIDLTKGEYALRIGEDILYNIPIEWGKVTQTDGKSYEQGE